MASFEMRLAVQGDLSKALAADLQAGKRAAMRVMRKRVDDRKTHIRAEVKRGGLGDKIANAVRGEVYPKHAQSLNPSGRVWSKAIVKGRTGRHDIILAFSEAREIVAKDGRRFLSIPTDKAGREGRRRKQPEDFPRGFLRFVQIDTRGLFAGGVRAGAILIGPDGVVYFVLVRKVKQQQRINPAVLVDDGAGIAEAIVAAWEQESQKVGVRFGSAA